MVNLIFTILMVMQSYNPISQADDEEHKRQFIL